MCGCEVEKAKVVVIRAVGEGYRSDLGDVVRLSVETADGVKAVEGGDC